MSDKLVTNNSAALAYLMTEDLYLVQENQPELLHPAIEKNKILILFYEYIAEELPDTDKAFLLKVLKAVNLSEQDIILLNRASLTDKKEELIAKYNAKIVLAFGVNELINGANSNICTISKVGDTTWLSAEELSVISKDVNRKSQLWESLKKIFNVG